MTGDEVKCRLTAECYRDPRVLPDGRWAAILPLAYTHAIVVGTVAGIRVGYDDRWCYHSYQSAKSALDAWDGDGEPVGWHRHPDSGRRVDPETGRIYVHF